MYYKVCVYAICKNEEQFVERYINSMNEADMIVVTDTGSSDNTVEKLREMGATVYEEKIVPWRFDKARNVSLSHVPLDADICVCTDLDEVFEKGWRKKLEKAWRKSEKQNKTAARQGRYVYNWSLNPDNSPDVSFIYSKIHERQGFIWSWPVHEWLSYIGKKPLEKVFIEDMVLNHYPDSAKSRSSYLPLLELGVSENALDDRMRYYLGREYMYLARWEECIEALEIYLNLPTATWREERCAAMRWIAKSCYMKGDREKAYSWYYKAIAEYGYMREPYIEFAKICYELKDWAMTLFLCNEALKIINKSTTYINMGYSWDHTPHDLSSIAAYNMGLLKRSMYHIETAIKKSPNEIRLKNNLNFIQELINTNDKNI